MRAAADLAVLEVEEQLRALNKVHWHPDRSPILKDLAEEVSKELNAACDELAA